MSNRSAAAKKNSKHFCWKTTKNKTTINAYTVKGSWIYHYNVFIQIQISTSRDNGFGCERKGENVDSSKTWMAGRVAGAFQRNSSKRVTDLRHRCFKVDIKAQRAKRLHAIPISCIPFHRAVLHRPSLCRRRSSWLKGRCHPILGSFCS